MLFLSFLIVVVGAHQPSDDLQRLLALTAHVGNGAPSWTAATPACKWDGVTCDPTTQTVVQIIWHAYNLTGTVNLTALPAGLEDLDLSANALTGTPDVATLPPVLSEIFLYANQFTGTLDLRTLPKGLMYLHLDSNRFTGHGTFTARNCEWCHSTFRQTSMCGATSDGLFNCSGSWACVPK